MSFDDDVFDAQRDEMNPGYLVAPGGWSTPADVIPQLLIPIRGGMRYPTPTERTDTMARSKAEIEAELKLNRELVQRLDQRETELVQELRKAVPAEPTGPHNRFSVEVKFAPHGKKYEFLLLRSPNGAWYTTGSGDHVKVFRNWAALVAWLEGPDVRWYSELRVLTKSDLAYSFPMGKVVDIDGGEPPF
ncbi:hypothetical protein SEA_ODYSSEY395_89 [Arthrobacter phage Odyssey395]|nr:hypothetical protein SEA_ODYSSEY395_89 [Arthrobacter phage Odyssey395]